MQEKVNQWEAELEVLAVNSGEWASEASIPQAEAISVASVWQMESPESADAALAGATGAYVYRRDGHPNERALGKKLAKLHGATDAVITAQGMSAIAAVALSALKPGDSVWVANELYGKTSKLFNDNLSRWGITCQTFDPISASDIDKIDSSKCKMVFIETLSNPTVRVPDIPSIARATHNAGGLLLVDNTFATHLLCQPLSLGADAVVESLSKQVNGHSDSMLGLVASSDSDFIRGVTDAVSSFGMASSPLDCFLTNRGVLTLAVRMERACANAMHLSTALQTIDAVQRVDFPGLTDHPQHKLAKDNLKGFGWMLSMTLDIDRQGVSRVLAALKPEICFVPSLGDVATTLSHPASTSHRALTEAQREAIGISEGTIRISCGIEPTDWLINKFTTALEQH